MSQSISQNIAPKKRENLFLSVLFCIGIPIFILSKANGLFGPTLSLLIALFFPFAYAVYDFVNRRQLNPISIIGFFSLLLKGSFALFKLDGILFAMQEAAIPAFLGLYALISLKFGKPLVNYFIYNETVFNIDLLEKKLIENQTSESFYKLTQQVTFIFGLAFLIGGVLNYFLAYNIIVSPAGTPEFNKELARMIFLSYLVVLIPKMILTAFGLWWLVHNLKKLTGLPLNDIWQVKTSSSQI